VGWGATNSQSSFRRELDEIAQLIGLNTTVSLLLNGDRQVVEVACGNQRAYYYADLLGLAREAYRAPVPGDSTDVVMVNAYPADLSLTFAQMKAFHLLDGAPPHASRIAIASCSEGLGYHALFPFMNAPKYHRQRMMIMHGRILLREPNVLARKVVRRLVQQVGFRRGASAPVTRNPTWLFRPGGASSASLPTLPEIPGIRVTSSWDVLLRPSAANRSTGASSK
jgi:hypothetical protein